MYAAGYGIRQMRASRAGGFSSAFRLAVAAGVVALASFGLALAVHGSPPAASTTVVVQPGDTLWSIANARYPGDDVRARVDDIEQANGLQGPVIRVGQTLQLPG